jgi:hypothetical protein
MSLDRRKEKRQAHVPSDGRCPACGRKVWGKSFGWVVDKITGTARCRKCFVNGRWYPTDGELEQVPRGRGALSSQEIQDRCTQLRKELADVRARRGT